MTETAHFGAELFAFLTDLRSNNNREWFQANKERYEDCVRHPALQFISEFGPRLRRISPQLRADPRTNGGSLFRIYRDTRFSRDKSPYKTYAGVQFRHKEGRDAHAPGYYLHLEPDGVFGGAGIWHPGSEALSKIRHAIVDNPTAWKRVLGDKRFQNTCHLSGDSLKRPPRGFDPDHPLVEDLKRKDFIAIQSFSDEEAVSTDFMDRFEDFCQAARPLQRFLVRALELEW